MSASGTSAYIPSIVRQPVDIIAQRAPLREARTPDLQRPEAFIEWGGPSDFTDNSFRLDSGTPVPREQDNSGKTVLDGHWTEEARTWEDYELSNPEDPDQKVILRRPTQIALKSLNINKDTKKFDQLTISLSYGGEDQAPHYHNAHGHDFKPSTFSLLTEIKEVHWGGPILLVLIGHYPESSMAGQSGDAPSLPLLGVRQQDELTNAINIEQSEQFPQQVDAKLAHYKGVVNVSAKLAQPEEDPPDSGDQGPAGDGWVGTPPEPVFQPYYGLVNAFPGGDPVPVFTGIQADHYTGPGVVQGKGGRRVFYDGYGFVLIDPIQAPDGTWVAQFKFTTVVYPDPGLSPEMHLGGLGGSGAIFDDHGNVGTIAPPGPPGPGDDEPQPDFVGAQHQWRFEHVDSEKDDEGTAIDNYWSYRLWTKAGKEEDKHKPAPAQVVGAIVNITKPLITERLLNTSATSYTLGVRYGGVEPNDKFKQGNKRGIQLRYVLFPRSRFDDLTDFLEAAAKRVDEKNQDKNFKYASLDDFMNEFSPPFASLESHKTGSIPNVTASYGNQFDLVVNLATGLEITLQT